MPELTDPYLPQVYQRARENLTGMMERGVLVQDSQANFYLYAMTLNGRTQHGIVGCVHIEDYEADRIKKHEKTRPDKEDDRTRHLLALSAHAEPVFLTYLKTPAISQCVANLLTHDPSDDFVTSDGVRHRVWVINDPAPITAAFGEIPVAYVADGHHRSASAWRAGAERRRANPNHHGDEDYNWFVAVMFPSDELQILPYNRLVTDLGGRTVEQVLDGLRKVGPLTPTETPEPQSSHSCGVYLDGNWYHLELPLPKDIPGDPTAQLDAHLLHTQVLDPVLGIGDPRTDPRLQFVGGIKGVSELQRKVDAGEAAMAFALYPVTVEQLMSVADHGKIMPPKTTWFEPKLLSGLFVHTFD